MAEADGSSSACSLPWSMPPFCLRSAILTRQRCGSRRGSSPWRCEGTAAGESFSPLLTGRRGGQAPLGGTACSRAVSGSGCREGPLCGPTASVTSMGDRAVCFEQRGALCAARCRLCSCAPLPRQRAAVPLTDHLAGWQPPGCRQLSTQKAEASPASFKLPGGFLPLKLFMFCTGPSHPTDLFPISELGGNTSTGDRKAKYVRTLMALGLLSLLSWCTSVGC